MKYLLILMILLAGCDDHKHPQRNKDKVDTPGVIHDTVTVTVTEPCDETSSTSIPDYWVIKVEDKNYSQISHLMDEAKDKGDENLWSELGRLYPETINGGWTASRYGDIIYIHRRDK